MGNPPNGHVAMEWYQTLLQRNNCLFKQKTTWWWILDAEIITVVGGVGWFPTRESANIHTTVYI